MASTFLFGGQNSEVCDTDSKCDRGSTKRTFGEATGEGGT